MAKIDVTSIKGYAEMTAEEKVAALEGFEFNETETEAKLKSAMSSANSETAKYKRERDEAVKKWKETLSEQEKAEAERVEREKEIQEELKSLRRDKTVSGYTAQCLTLGYGAELARKAAEAMADGDAAEIINCQKEFMEAKTKEIEANALNRQPTLTSGAPPTAKTAEAEAYNNMRKAWGLKPISTK